MFLEVRPEVARPADRSDDRSRVSRYIEAQSSSSSPTAVLDGHHKMQAAAESRQKVRLLTFLSVDGSLAAEESIHRLPKIRRRPAGDPRSGPTGTPRKCRSRTTSAGCRVVRWGQDGRVDSHGSQADPFDPLGTPPTPR